MPASAYEGGKIYSSPDGPPAIGAFWAEGNPQADFMFKTYVAPPVTPPPTGGGNTAPTGKRTAANQPGVMVFNAAQ